MKGDTAAAGAATKEKIAEWLSAGASAWLEGANVQARVLDLADPAARDELPAGFTPPPELPAAILVAPGGASMILPGQALLVYEMTPALFAAVAANEAERAAPELTIVDVQMIGAAGRLYIGGSTKDVTAARDRITAVLAGIEGRDH